MDFPDFPPAKADWDELSYLIGQTIERTEMRIDGVAPEEIEVEKAKRVAAAEETAHRIAGGVVLKSLATMTPKPVEWLWRGRIPLGKITVLDGNPGTGKSTLTMALAATFSRGGKLFDGEQLSPMNSIILSAEDGIEDTIIPRLCAHNANLDRITVLDAVCGEYDDGGVPRPDRPFNLPGDMPQLKYAVASTEAKFVVIDPLMAFLGGSVDSHRDQDVRRALHPLSEMADDYGCAVLIVRHLNKGNTGLALTRGGGSIGIIGAARAGLILGFDPNDPTAERRVLAVSKMNLGKPGSSLAYHLDEDLGYDCAHITWEGFSPHTSETILTTLEADDVFEVGRASDMMKEILGINGTRLASDVISSLRKSGIQDRHIAKARRMIGVIDCVTPGGTTWSIQTGGVE